MTELIDLLAKLTAELADVVNQLNATKATVKVISALVSSLEQKKIDLEKQIADLAKSVSYTHLLDKRSPPVK